MDLRLDPGLGSQYRNKSQVARVVTEAWAAANLYCLACPSDHLTITNPNTRVRDFSCPECGTSYQLKSKNGKHGRVAANSAYGPKIAAIDRGIAPHYAFLDYNGNSWTVTGLFVTPGHFITRSVVQSRKPLPDTARRAGWVGSNILLREIPQDGKITLVSESHARNPELVRGEWSKVAFLSSDTRASGGWGAEVLACVRLLQSETGEKDFTLQSFYSRFVGPLSRSHPDNHNVEAKIRQQLQVLRDGGILNFQGRGCYHIIS